MGGWTGVGDGGVSGGQRNDLLSKTKTSSRWVKTMLGRPESGGAATTIECG